MSRGRVGRGDGLLPSAFGPFLRGQQFASRPAFGEPCANLGEWPADRPSEVDGQGQLPFADGDFQLTDGGRLNGAGWYQVSTNLSMSNTTRTVSNLNLRTDGVIDGAGDLRVTGSLVWQGGEFGGEAGSRVSIVGNGRIANPEGGGEDIFTLNNRKLSVLKGKQLFIEHSLRLVGEASIENYGVVNVAGQFDEGIEINRTDESKASILNRGDWTGDGNRYRLPFINDNGSVDVSTHPQVQLNTLLEDYRQIGTNAILTLTNSIVTVNTGSILGGNVEGGDDEAKLSSKLFVGSKLDEAAVFRLGRLAGNQLWLDRLTFVTDDRSLLRIDADVMLKDSICYLAGRTVWSGGDIKQFRGGDPEIPGTERPSYILNMGEFYIDCDNTLYVEQLYNKGLVVKVSGDESGRTDIFTQYIDKQTHEPGRSPSTQVRVGNLVLESAFAEHELSATVFIADNAGLRFEGINSVTKLYDGATFIGGGKVYVENEAMWKLQDGSIVKVNNFVVQGGREPLEGLFLPGKITGKGVYYTDPTTDNAFGSRLVVRNAAELSSFDVSNIELRLAANAYLGIHADDGVDPDNPQVTRRSAFSRSLVTALSGSLVYTSGGDFYLRDNSEIHLSDAKPNGPAVFEFRSSSSIRTSGNLDEESVIVVGAGSILTRSPISAGDVSNIDVPIINDGGNVTLRGMTLQGTYTFNNDTKAGYYQKDGTTRLLDDSVIVWQGVRIDYGSFDLNGHTMVVNGSGLIIGRPSAYANPRDATLIARGKVVGDIINRGMVQLFDHPTNPIASFTVDGNLNLTTSGTVVYRLGTHEVGVGSDYIRVTGTAKLGGTVKLVKTGSMPSRPARRS